VLGRWDGGAYLEIARDGYSYRPGEISNVTFSPLLPLLMRILASLAGRPDDDGRLAAGVLVSNVALLAAVVLLVRVGRTEIDEGAGRRAAIYALTFPTTIFLSAVYPESLFLALSLGTVLAARRGSWWAAAALGGLAAVARPFGVLLALPVALERGQRDAARVVAVAAPLVAFAGWHWYLFRVTGDPLVFLSAQAAYGRRPTSPAAAITDLFDPSRYGDPWIVIAILVPVAALVVISWRLLSRSIAAYGTVLLLAALSSGTVTSFPRYALAIFPAFLALGALGRWRAVHLAYLAVATTLAVTLTAMFASWFWIG
jgi:hypothetical protein